MTSDKKNKNIASPGIISLDHKDFKRLSSFIMSQFGIKMPEIKKTMLQSRLQKRLKALDYKTFKEYVDYLFSAQGQKDELTYMVDAVSTHKTDFFRERIHFDFLYSHGLKEYLENNKKSKIQVWSAGCSSGEEPYSIAIMLKEFSLKQFLDFQILATDISMGVLQLAIVGIYHDDKIETIPDSIRKKYFLKGKNEYEHKVRVITELRNKINFQKFNLLSTHYKALGKFDIIFCRNVLIYFEREVQERLLRQFCDQLNPGGYLFLGHSESITGISLPLKHLKPTIYIKT